MKRFLSIAAVLLALGACSKTGPKLYSGYYSFKTGGTVEITGKAQTLLGEKDTTIIRHLVPESGQMHILETGENQMKVTLNITGGDPLVVEASVKNDVLVLSPTRQRVTVSAEKTLSPNENYYWELSGSGKRYENLVLFDLNYAGKYCNDGITGDITKCAIICIATQNE